MKKNKRKIILKYFSILSVIFLLCSVFVFPVSAADLTTINYSNPDMIPYDDSQPIVIYSFDGETSLYLGNSTDVYFNTAISSSNELIVTVVDGVLSWGVLTIPVVDVVNGTYMLYGAISSAVYSDYGEYFVPIVQDVTGMFTGDNTLCFKFNDDIPSNIDVHVESFDYNLGSTVITYLFVPYEEKPVTESITDIWSLLLVWIQSVVSTVTGVFYDGTALTLLGTLSLIGVCIGLVILIVIKIKYILSLR